MDLALIAVGYILAPLIFVFGFVYLGNALGRAGGHARGHQSFAELYTTNANCPANTRVSFLLTIGIVCHGLGHSGSTPNGLYVHPGMMGDALFVPWPALRTLLYIGSYVVLRERKTGTWIAVPRRVLSERPTPWAPR